MKAVTLLASVTIELQPHAWVDKHDKHISAIRIPSVTAKLGELALGRYTYRVRSDGEEFIMNDGGYGYELKQLPTAIADVIENMLKLGQREYYADMSARLAERAKAP